jgi:hypothetical protein
VLGVSADRLECRVGARGGVSRPVGCIRAVCDSKAERLGFSRWSIASIGDPRPDSSRQRNRTIGQSTQT